MIKVHWWHIYTSLMNNPHNGWCNTVGGNHSINAIKYALRLREYPTRR